MAYVAVTRDRFEAEMNDMGFTHINIPGTAEMVFERDIPKNDFAVRIYSTIMPRTRLSRDVGKDAIRIQLFNKVKDRPIKSEGRVNRTGTEDGVMERTRQRARDAWAWATKAEHQCDSDGCGGLMTKRTGKNGEFLGCSNYPECKNTAQVQ